MTLRQQWLRKAELAVSREQDDLARAALERALSHQRMAEGFATQHADQTAEAETPSRSLHPACSKSSSRPRPASSC